MVRVANLEVWCLAPLGVWGLSPQKISWWRFAFWSGGLGAVECRDEGVGFSGFVSRA